MKRYFSFLCLFPLFGGLFFPMSAMASGLGEAGSLTLNGLVIGLTVLGVIFLIFMGLLLMSRVREYSSLIRNKDADAIHFEPEDIINLSASEIDHLLSDRREHKGNDNK